jgi:hypothetical protein
VSRAFLAFAAVFFVFHQIGSVLGSGRAEAAIDFATPFLVVATSWWLLRSLGAPRPAVLVAVFAGALYVHGHGIHLAANSIHNEGFSGDAVYFWDERVGHIEAAIGWFGLVAAFCLAEARRKPGAVPAERPLLAAAALLLGWTFFTSTVEGQTWWLELATAAAFAAWALRARAQPRPLLIASTAAFGLGALLIGVWAAWHGGVPEFSSL